MNDDDNATEGSDKRLPSSAEKGNESGEAGPGAAAAVPDGDDGSDFPWGEPQRQDWTLPDYSKFRRTTGFIRFVPHLESYPDQPDSDAFTDFVRRYLNEQELAEPGGPARGPGGAGDVTRPSSETRRIPYDTFAPLAHDPRIIAESSPDLGPPIADYPPDPYRPSLRDDLRSLGSGILTGLGMVLTIAAMLALVALAFGSCTAPID